MRSFINWFASFSFIKKIFLLIILACILIPSNAFAGERKGFLFNLSAGGGGTYIYSEDAEGDNTINDFGPSFSFRMGYAPIDQLQIFLGFTGLMFRPDIFKETWTEMPDYLVLLSVVLFPVLLPVSVISSSHSMIEILGARYYFNSVSPGFYTGGGIGVSAIYDPFLDKGGAGFGLWAEGGYEFAKYFSIKLYLFGGRTKTEKYYSSIQERREYHTIGVSAALMAELCMY